MTGMEKNGKAAGRIVMVTAIMAFTQKDAVITQKVCQDGKSLSPTKYKPKNSTHSTTLFSKTSNK